MLLVYAYVQATRLTITRTLVYVIIDQQVKNTTLPQEIVSRTETYHEKLALAQHGLNDRPVLKATTSKKLTEVLKGNVWLALFGAIVV